LTSFAKIKSSALLCVEQFLIHCKGLQKPKVLERLSVLMAKVMDTVAALPEKQTEAVSEVCN